MTPNGGAPYADVLMFEGEVLTRWRLTVGRRGLWLLAPPEARLIAWSALVGFDADHCERSPDGRIYQVLTVETDHERVRLLVAAPELAVLLAEVRHRSARWTKCRRSVITASRARGRVDWESALTLGIAVRASLGSFGLLPGSRLALLAMWNRATGLCRRLAGEAAKLLAVVPGARLLGRGDHGSRPRARASLLATTGVVTAALGALVVFGPMASGAPQDPASLSIPHTKQFELSSMGRMARALRALVTKPLNLAAATTPPAPALPSLADAAPLSPHEVFGFAPYWELPVSSGFDVGGLTTLAYFSIGVNPDGSLDHSDNGWVGYQSQALSDLVTRAHLAGDRVVLTVTCFSQGALDQLTSSPTAPATLSAALVSAIESKNLDGVNLDFEGEGSRDQAGLTNLVANVSATLHHADPHWQVTMDTYASSAGDSGGFYNVPALAPWVDGFFVMAYQLNLSGVPTGLSPLTSGMFSDLTTSRQYAASVPPSKVILGLPYFGYDWPTTDGTMAAQATGAAEPITYGQVASSGHPIYWDPVTDTAWTSYQVGSQWHESYVENPISLYKGAQMAQAFHFAGVGAWALGMDGNDPAMTAALDGLAPAVKVPPPGPPSTSLSVVPPSPPTPPAPPPSSPAPGIAGGTGPASSGSPNASPGPATGSAPSQGNAGTASAGFTYLGSFQGQSVTLTLEASSPAGSGTGPPLPNRLSDVLTTDPKLTCLVAETSTNGTGLAVWPLAGSPNHYVAVADQSKGDCTTAFFVFSGGSGGSASTTTTTTTTTTTVPTTAPGGGTAAHMGAP